MIRLRISDSSDMNVIPRISSYLQFCQSCNPICQLQSGFSRATRILPCTENITVYDDSIFDSVHAVWFLALR